MDWTRENTIVAIATPPGRGGVAVLRLSGRDCRAIAARLFRPASGNVEDWVSHQMRYGSVVDPADQSVVDRGFVVWMQAPQTFTGEEVVEFHIHGGTVGPEILNDLLIRSGAKQAAAGEFSFRAFLNGKMSLDQAEALKDVIDSQNEFERRLATQRLGGIWREELEAVVAIWAELLAQLEVDLDFPEEDLQTAELEARRTTLEGLLKRLQQWERGFERGRIARQRISVVLAGAANAGKSSIFNWLCGEQRAIVDSVPGTTRDFLEAHLDIHGIPFRLVDTAGLRPGGVDPVEALGMGRSREWIDRAEIVLEVCDASNPSEERIPGAFLTLWNKVDRLSTRPLYDRGLAVSAVSGEGMGQLLEALCDEAKVRWFGVGGDGYVINERQRQCVGIALQSLQEALSGLGRRETELVAEDLWRGLRSLEAISGRGLAPSVIDAIFSGFCIGK